VISNPQEMAKLKPKKAMSWCPRIQPVVRPAGVIGLISRSAPASLLPPQSIGGWNPGGPQGIGQAPSVVEGRFRIQGRDFGPERSHRKRWPPSGS
jgi:hypothetical protein